METKRRRNKQKNYKNNWKTSNKMAISTYLSIVTLNINGLNAPIKRHRVADWIKNRKEDPSICCLQEIRARAKDTHRSKVRGWKTYFMQL